MKHRHKHQNRSGKRSSVAGGNGGELNTASTGTTMPSSSVSSPHTPHTPSSKRTHAAENVPGIEPLHYHRVIIHMEIFLCLYLMVHAMLQFYNIFRTNVFHYDLYVVVLCLIVPVIHMLIKTAMFQDQLPVFKQQQRILFRWLQDNFRMPPPKPGKRYMNPKSVVYGMHALLSNLVTKGDANGDGVLLSRHQHHGYRGGKSGEPDSTENGSNSGNGGMNPGAHDRASSKVDGKKPMSTMASSSVSSSSSSTLSSSFFGMGDGEDAFWNLRKLLLFLQFKRNVLLLYMLSVVALIAMAAVLRFVFDTHGIKPVLLTILPVLLYFCATGGISLYDTIMHTIPSDDETTTHDTKFVRQAYTIRGRQTVKSFLYSVCGPSFYATVLPMAFVPHTTYYERSRCVLMCIFVSANCCIMNYIQFLHEYFLRTLYHIKVVGCWKKVHSVTSAGEKITTAEASDASNPQSHVGPAYTEKIASWSHKKLPYVKGSLVRYKDDIYQALGDQNTGYPGKTTDLLMYKLFRRPERTHTVAIYVQGGITLTQLLMLQTWSVWNVAVITLLFNYYILWELVGLWLQHRDIMARLLRNSPSRS